MPIYSVQGPDGRIYEVEGPAGASEAQVVAAVRRQYLMSPPSEATTPKSGFTPALKSGFSELKSGIAALAGRTGIMDPTAAEKYISEQEAYQKRTFKPTETFGEAPVTKTLELLGGSLPYAAAPLIAGGAAASAPVSVPVATALGLGATGLASATQFTGSNLRRQMEEGKSLEQTELGAAALAAVPQAALDVVGFKMIPGVRNILTAAGKEVPPAVAKRIAEQGLKEVAKDYAAATGKAMGVEGLTEAGQQVLERLQAGLNIADEKAREEYFDSFLGGAVLGGALSPAGRYVERRGEAAKQEEARLADAQKLRAQEDAQREAEKARRATPEGQLELVKDYEARLARFNELKSVPRPGKGADPLEQSNYTEVKKERAELGASLSREAQVYKQAKAAVAQLQEQQRLQGLSPEDFMLEQMGLSQPTAESAAPAEPTKMVSTIDEMGRITDRPEGVEEEQPPSAAAQYAAEQLEAARNMGALDLTDQVAFLAAKPEMATALLSERPEIAGLSRKQSNALYDALKLRVTPIIKGAQKEAAAQQERLRGALEGQQPNEAFLQAVGQQPGVVAAQEEQAKEQSRLTKIRPEVEALQRMGQRGNISVGQGQVSGLVDRLVETALRSDGKATGRVVAGAATADVSQADALRGQLALARVTDNRPRAQQIVEQLKALGESETDTGGELELGETTKTAGVEGRLSAQAIMDNRVTRMSQSQMSAFDRLADFVQTVRESDQNVAEAKKQTLRDAAERLKDTIVGLALNEMDARRAQAGLPELTTQKKLLAVSRLNGVLNELVNRGAGVFNIKETPAVTRGTLTVRGAEQRRPPAGERLFNNFTAAANSLRAQMRNAIDEVGEIKAPEPRKAAPVKPRVAEGLRMMFQGQERTAADQYAAAFDRAKSDEDYRTLKELQRMSNSLSPEGQQLAMEQVRRVELGQPIEMPEQLRQEVASLREGARNDLGQQEMFAGSDERGDFRASTANFMRFINSAEVQKRKMQIDEARKQADFQAKRAQTIQRKLEEEQKKQADILAKLELAKNKSPVEAAKERLASVADKNAEAVRIAREVNSQRLQSRNRIAGMVRQLEDSLEAAKKKEAEVTELVDYIVEKALVYPRNEQYQKSMGQFLDQQSKAAKAVAAVQAALDKAKALQAKVLEDHASDTIDNALIAEGAKAQRKIDAAQQALKAAMDEEAGAKRRLAAVRQDITPPRPQTEAERLAALPASSVVKVTRDTSDPKVQEQVASLRKLIGKAEEEHARAQTSGDEKAMEESLKAVESAYDKMYEVLNNAPVRREDRMSPTEAAAMAEFEAAQRDAFEKTIALFQEKAGVKPLKLTQRRTVASVKNVKSGRVETQIKQESVAQQEKRVKQEEATGQYAARALEELAKARAELKTVQDQIAYIDANPAAPRSEAKARQKAARTAAVAKRQEIEAKISNLSKAQKEVVAEARTDKEAEKALKKERRRMLRGDAEGDVYAAGASEYALSRVRYAGKAWDSHDAPTSYVLLDVLQAVGDKAPGPNNLSSAIASVRDDYKYDLALLRETPETSADAIEHYQEKLDVLNSLRIEKFLIAKATRPVEQVARPVRTAPRAAFTKPTAKVGPEALAKKFGTELDTTAPVHDMTFAEAARYGAKRTTSPQVRLLFERLAEVFDAAPAEFAGKVYATKGPARIDGRLAAGLYAGSSNEILTVSPSSRSGQANKTLLHELTHAATVYALNMSPDLNAQVEALRLRVVEWLETPAGKAYFRNHGMGLGKNRQSIYGLKNSKEFLSELFADREFQKMLTQIPSNKPRKSIFTRFVEALSKFFSVPGEAGQSMFAEAVALTDDILSFTVREVYKVPSLSTIAAGDYDVQPLLIEEPRYATPEMERLGQDTDKVVSKQRSLWEKIKLNTTGMAFATQLVDRFAGFERLAKYMDSLKGSQMLYYLRMYDQRMNFTAQAVAEGAPQLVEKTRADGRKEFVLESKEGANIKNVVKILSKAQPMVGNAEAVNRAFTMYLAALRAQRVGLAALNFDKEVTQKMLDDTISLVDRTPGLKKVFDEARAEYNAYNRDLMKFLASTGAISQKLADRLASTNDYIPFYREQDGNAMLIIGGETPFKIGNIAEQPYLQELVGGDTAILDFMNSSVQNTSMLVDMGLRNLATKNAVFELLDLNAAKIVKGRPDGSDVVKFKVDGEDRYAVLDTESVTIGGQRFNTGVPAELLVKGMEGIPTQMPVLLRAMAMPSQLLRKAVTLSPLYMAKQLFRDSLAAPIVSGANFTPVFGAIKQINSATGKTLESRGVTGGQYLSGTNEDITKILRDISDGKPGWMSALGKLESMGMAADSLTRRAQYNSYIQQGLSEMEATLMALESMNFNKRGASPSIHMANSLIPFLNAQIQGLNVLYKAFTGNMPFNDRLKLQQKLLVRGGLIAGASLIYAAMMEDDEAYQNAAPDQKYGNWFVRVPGVDEPLRLPVPFEIGYIFKALPEALYNTMTSEQGGEEAVKAFKQILLNTIPGGSSYGLPQALKPAIEAGLGKSFYTGRDILSAREKELLPEEQFRANTAEISKLVGKELGISPVNMEYLVRGYTGTLGIAFLHALSLGAPKSESPEAAVKRLSEYPLVGGSFQPNDAGGIINNVYERFNEDMKVRNSYKKLVTEGRMAEANDLLQRRGNEIMEAEIGDVFKQNMNKLTQAERAVAASAMPAEEKRKQLDEIRRIKTSIARMMREVADKTTPR